ncbi:MAG: hypothetical protein ABI623_03805 [bacterium]
MKRASRKFRKMYEEKNVEQRPAFVRYFLRKPDSFNDLLIILVSAAAVFVLAARFDVFKKILDWMYSHDTWKLDELFTVTIYLVIATAVYAWRRHRELVKETQHRLKAETEKAQLAPRLESALADVSILKALLPMCTSCKRVRDDQGYWDEVESYIENHFSTRMDAGLCPDCAVNIYRNGPILHRRNGEAQFKFLESHVK